MGLKKLYKRVEGIELMEEKDWRKGLKRDRKRIEMAEIGLEKVGKDWAELKDLKIGLNQLQKKKTKDKEELK